MANTSNGTNSNTFSFKDAAGNTFQRRVDAALNIITLDEQSGNLAPSPDAHLFAGEHNVGNVGHARLPGGRIIGV